MQEVAVVRRTAKEVLEGVEPERLHDRIVSRLDRSSMTAGVLAVRCARAVLDRRGTGGTQPVFERSDDSLADAIARRAVGVQLIYEGLALTRTLAQNPPWLADRKAEGDLDVLIADIMVARGFYLLARTEAADEAVATVRAFGRDQTVRRETDDPSLDRSLEADVYELATVAGTTAVGGQPSPSLREYADSLARKARTNGGTAEPESDQLARLVSVDSTASDGVRTSADH
ncbi:conserved hypothetical protein [Halorhabdus utahensis DSM 12940]|uniref:Uncharacterized protein n=1 Tax=Halorhabdus utahensis (strain DSM 12940 / JCM 11049 / AX-2) TaxID=519442 RepID=C7NNC9_HALUD|nr:hypothetical protein [Halorhabdus utahensis]ACV11529.1 conserved hypothetical protein [Halorhabdus utahensis DSM 12940]